MTPTDQLQQAIRAITVEAPDDQPNGPAEAALQELAFILKPSEWGTLTAAQRARTRRLNGAMSQLCRALADDTRALRLAAEAYFGGDFSAPVPPTDKEEPSGK